MDFQFRTASRGEILDTLPMREFYVDRELATISAVEELEDLLSSTPDERQLQSFLSRHLWMLAPWAGPGPVRWAFSQKKLSIEYVTDFLAADWRSFGISWTAIELESPKAKMLTKSGDFTARTNHAIRQIQDWRTWLGQNIDYAWRPKDKNGLGLAEIDSNIKGVIFIGRRMNTDKRRMHGANSSSRACELVCIVSTACSISREVRPSNRVETAANEVQPSAEWAQVLWNVLSIGSGSASPYRLVGVPETGAVESLIGTMVRGMVRA